MKTKLVEFKNNVMPIGCEAIIDAEKKYFSIDEETVL